MKDFLHNNGIYIYDAVEVIKEFYGEEFVDDSNIYQATSIDSIDSIYRNMCNHNYVIVHFPCITVTNEFGKSTELYDVYIKICLTCSGKLDTFKISKGIYTYSQAKSRYIHSHTPSWSPSYIFQPMCLGRGPFKDYMGIMMRQEYLETNWNLFCVYLKNYLEVESVSGVPYKRLESLGTTSDDKSLDEIVKHKIRTSQCLSVIGSNKESVFVNIPAFIRYIADKNIIPYNYIGDKYDIALSISDFAIKISNAFVDYANENNYTINDRYFRKYMYSNGRVYKISEEGSIPDDFENKFLFKFKNKEVRIRILDKAKEVSFNYIYTLIPELITFIYYNLISFINRYYGTKDKRTGQEKFI